MQLLNSIKVKRTAQGLLVVANWVRGIKLFVCFPQGTPPSSKLLPDLKNNNTPILTKTQISFKKPPLDWFIERGSRQLQKRGLLLCQLWDQLWRGRIILITVIISFTNNVVPEKDVDGVFLITLHKCLHCNPNDFDHFTMWECRLRRRRNQRRQ